MKHTFVYVTYIRTMPAKLWEALTTPEFNRRFWLGAHQESGWQKGDSWTLRYDDGPITDTGEIVEAQPGKRLVLRWRNEFMPDLKAEGFSRCTFDISENGNDVTELRVTHETDGANFLKAVSGGWPMVLSGLKTLLETGAPLGVARQGEAKAA